MIKVGQRYTREGSTLIIRRYLPDEDLFEYELIRRGVPDVCSVLPSTYDAKYFGWKLINQRNLPDWF